MKKLELKVEELHVESFAAETEERERGTVKAFVSIHLCTGGADASCPCEPDYNYTQWASCGGNSCAYTCTTCNPYGCGSCGP